MDHMPAVTEFERLPSLTGGYLRALFSRKPGLRGGTIPRVEALIRGVVPDPARVEAYRRVCGIAPATDLPITYPAVLGAPLHLAILTSPGFPLNAMGIIHCRNVIEQRLPVPSGAPVDVRAWVEGHRDVPSGVEFDLVTEASVDGEAVWSSTTTILSRVPGRRGGGAKPEEPSWEPARTATWCLPPNLGRQYASVSGDYNPIHLHPLTARMLGGFPRPIVHGMWSLARVVGEVGTEAPQGPASLDVEFRRPVYLPSDVEFACARDESGAIRYTVRAAKDRKLCLCGIFGAI